jgi:hypothetical protein
MLTVDEQSRFAEAWNAIQVRFVDRPEEAVTEADVLVQDVMRARGYPTTDFEQQAEDLSVEHPVVVSNYRSAHAIAEAHRQQPATTEVLRRAFLHYRALFDELLGDPTTAPTTSGASAGGRRS